MFAVELFRVLITAENIRISWLPPARPELRNWRHSRESSMFMSLLYWRVHHRIQNSRCVSVVPSRGTGSPPSTCWQCAAECSPTGWGSSLLWSYCRGNPEDSDGSADIRVLCCCKKAAQMHSEIVAEEEKKRSKWSS